MKKLKRALALLVCLAVCACALPLSASAEDVFTDVSESAWYYQYVYDLYDAGLIAGLSENEYSPRTSLTRGQVVTVLARLYLTQDEIGRYAYNGTFSDVKREHWCNDYVNWASSAGVVSGYEDGTFKPANPITREELCVMINNFCWMTGQYVQEDGEAADFSDQNAISSWAVQSVSSCQKAGLVNGYPEDNSFRPRNGATRAEAARVLSELKNNLQKNEGYTLINKRIDGVNVRAVEFSPSEFKPHVAFAKDMTDGSESFSSIVSRTGAVFAINGAFFDMSNYLPLSNIITGGVVRASDGSSYADYRSTFTVDSSGNSTVENFSLDQTAVLTDASTGLQWTVDDVGCNRWPNSSYDGTRLIMTRDWGTTLAFPTTDAVTVGADGIITMVTHWSDKNYPLPESGEGFVLCQRARREYEGDFFDNCKEGDKLEIRRSYSGASTQDIELSISAGPRLVQNGAIYGGSSTYRQEGYSDSVTLSTTKRVCLGIKPDGNIVLVKGSAPLPQMAQVLVTLGCRDAVNFDGGASVGLYADGRYLETPGRLLNTVVYFKAD